MNTVAVFFDTPPSVNKIWKPGARDFFKSKEYQIWSRGAAAEVMAARAGGLKFTGPIDVTVVARRHNVRADLDNIIKPLLDALQTGQLIENDAQVDRLQACWAGRATAGQLAQLGRRDVLVEVRAC